MSADYLDRLAQFVVNTNLENLDPSVVIAAKKVVLDTLGAMLAGSRFAENASFARLAQEMGGPGPATLLGHSGRTSPVFATLANATAGVALELDEGSRLGGGHPSIHVTPGAIAVAEELGASGRALLESVIVGYEVTSRIGTGTKTREEIHSHGTWGTIGAAAATAKLLGFDADQTKLAMNLSMSMSPANTWTPCLEGATIRNLYPGRSGFQGIMAAHLARCGFTGVRDGPADLYEKVLGEGFDPAAVVAGLGSGLDQGEPLRIQANYFKFHACCLYNHPVLDAVQTLLVRGQFGAAEVDRVQVVAPPIVQLMTDPEPETMLSSKFSIPYAVAAALVQGDTGVEAFYDERRVDPGIRDLAHRVEVLADPEMNMRRFDYPAARVTVTLRDGRSFNESVTAHRGDSHNPRTDAELTDKFVSLAGETLGEQRTRQVIETVERLDTLGDIRELTGLLGES
jgi:2-methylcitrate dehydratase PrpD